MIPITEYRIPTLNAVFLSHHSFAKHIAEAVDADGVANAKLIIRIIAQEIAIISRFRPPATMFIKVTVIEPTTMLFAKFVRTPAKIRIRMMNMN